MGSGKKTFVRVNAPISSNQVRNMLANGKKTIEREGVKHSFLMEVTIRECSRTTSEKDAVAFSTVMEMCMMVNGKMVYLK